MTGFTLYCYGILGAETAIFRILSLIPHEARPRLDGSDGWLSVSHFTDSEDRSMLLVQWAGPVTKPLRHHPGAA